MGYVKNMYKNQASSYGRGVANLNNQLDEAISCLEGVDKILGIDPKNSKDLLTYNVVIGNQEIKNEIKELTSELNNYSSVIKKKAIEIDNRIEEEIAKKEAKELNNRIKETKAENKKS